jgi:hypothetical protein
MRCKGRFNKGRILVYIGGRGGIYVGDHKRVHIDVESNFFK